VTLLGEQIGPRSAPFVRHALHSPRAESRDAAMEVLELSGAATDADRIAVAKADLADDRAGCISHKAAVRRLALVQTTEATQLLSSWHGECGAPEARDAVRHRTRLAAAH